MFVQVIDLFQWDGWMAMVRGLQNTVRPTGDTRTAVTMEQLQAMVQYCDTDKALATFEIGVSIRVLRLIEAVEFSTTDGKRL